MSTALIHTADLSTYQPTDLLYLWWLGQPQRPVLIGELSTARASRGVALRYANTWLQNGFALSEDLPLQAGEFLPSAKDQAAGAVDDARPDRWGERVIRYLDKPARLSIMEYLFLAGDERFGALGVSLSKEVYLPRRQGPLPELGDVAQINKLVQKIVAGEPVAAALHRLVAPGATMGGARPKALINIQGHAWVLKFAEPGDHVDTALVEHATMQLAKQAQIRVASTEPIALVKGAKAIKHAGPNAHALAVKRFDRQRGGHRLHAISAHVALKAAGLDMSYPELAQLLRRRGVVAGNVYRKQMAELFRRMVFNILMDNTDDHEKNHVLLMTDAGHYSLSPAFDVLPSGHALGYQMMRVGVDNADATLANALSEHNQFGLTRADAEIQMRKVVSVVLDWKEHFAAAGVSKAHIASLAQQIDRPVMAEQRSEWVRAAAPRKAVIKPKS